MSAPTAYVYIANAGNYAVAVHRESMPVATVQTANTLEEAR